LRRTTTADKTGECTDESPDPKESANLKYRVEESKQVEVTLVGKADLFQQYGDQGL
jgi:hypothetical protein